MAVALASLEAAAPFALMSVGTVVPAPQTTLCRIAKKGEKCGDYGSAQVGRTIMAAHWPMEEPPSRDAALIILRGLEVLLAGCADADRADIATCRTTTATIKDLLRRREAMAGSRHACPVTLSEVSQDIVVMLRRVGLLAENALLQCAWTESLRSHGLSTETLHNFIAVARRVAADREIDFHQAVLRTVRNQPVKITRKQAQAIDLVADLLGARQQWKRIPVPPLVGLSLPQA